MGKISTLLYFERHNKSLFKAGYSKKLTLLANGLKKYGVVSKFYLNDKLGSFYDLVDELDFFESSVVFVLLEEENYDFGLQIGKELGDTLEDKRVVFLTDCKIDDQEVEVIPVGELHQAVKKMLEYLGGNIQVSLEEKEIYNSYSNGTLFLNTTNNIGVNLDKKYFDDVEVNSFNNVCEELEYISCKTQNGQEVYLDTDDITKYVLDRVYRKKLSSMKEMLFSSNAPAENINEKTLKGMIECNINKMSVSVKNDSDMKNMESLIFSRKYAIQFKLEIDMSKVSMDIVTTSVECIIKSGCVNILDFKFVGAFDKEREIFERLNGKLEYSRYGALLNGMERLFTGMYSENVADGNIKHLVVKSLEELTTESFVKLRNYMGLNNAIYYFDNSDNDKEALYPVEQLKKRAVKGGFALENFIILKKNNGKYNVYINDEYIMDVYIDKYANIKAPKGQRLLNEYYTFIKDEQDLRKFKENIDQYYMQGKVDTTLVSYKVINMCRWSDVKNCYIKRIPRALLKNGEFYFCGDGKRSCGSIDDMPFETVQKIFVQRDKTEVERNCLKCDKVEVCSKCSFSESVLDQSEYCDFVKNKDGVGVYLHNLRFIKAIFDVSVELKGQAVEDFSFFCKNCTDGVEDIENGTTNYLMSGVQIFENKTSNRYYLCNPYLCGLLALNKDMYFITKLLIKMLPAEEILKIISKQYNITRDSAVESLKYAIELLRGKGCLSSTVNVAMIL